MIHSWERTWRESERKKAAQPVVAQETLEDKPQAKQVSSALDDMGTTERVRFLGTGPYTFYGTILKTDVVDGETFFIIKKDGWKKPCAYRPHHFERVL